MEWGSHANAAPRAWWLAGLAIALACVLVTLTTSSAFAQRLSGAIFTTLEDGSAINANLYDAKEDVYLDGGPGPHAPAHAAGLPEGDYYFQVTDPSGKDLLSSDHISCRRVHISAQGFIDHVYPGVGYGWNKSQLVEQACLHQSGYDIDYGPDGAITVQLYPYDDTPNPGGVYKAWLTPVDAYQGNVELVPQMDGRRKNIEDFQNGEDYRPGYFHGFVPSRSKTDNFKVREQEEPPIPPTITVRKFEDLNGDGTWDDGEPEVGVDIYVDGAGVVTDQQSGGGWPLGVLDPLTVLNSFFTPAAIEAPIAGSYTVEEGLWASWGQTAAILDGEPLAATPSVAVAVSGEEAETHEVIFGNFRCFEITGTKYEDVNGDGNVDDDLGIEGWTIYLFRASGSLYASTMTDAFGAYAFTVCEGGRYEVIEESREGWNPRGAVSYTFTGASGVDQGPFDFMNFHCFGLDGGKFEDDNGNGTTDPGETGIPGWSVTLSGGGQPPRTVVTGPDGTYTFEICGGGEYTITEAQPEGWVATSPASFTFDAMSGQAQVVNFHNFACFHLSVAKFYDADEDGYYGGANECPVLGFSFDLLHNDEVVATLTTGVDGTASAIFCEFGAYTVVEQSHAGWRSTTPATVSFEAVSGDAVELLFGNVKAFIGGLTIGYWKAHTGCANTGTPVDPIYDPQGARCSELGLTGGSIALGVGGSGDSILVESAQDAFAVFDAANCADTCVLMLRAQLLGAKLNARSFPGFWDALLGGVTVGEIIVAADTALMLGDWEVYGYLAGLLDKANNNHDGQTLFKNFCAP